MKCKNCGHDEDKHFDSAFKGACYECGRELCSCPCFEPIKEEKCEQ